MPSTGDKEAGYETGIRTDPLVADLIKRTYQKAARGLFENLCNLQARLWIKLNE